MGMHHSQQEPCVYKSQHTVTPFLIAIYVDDLVIACKSIEAAKELEQNLMQKFAIKVMGVSSFVLSMLITRYGTRRTFSISQAACLKSILKWFDMMKSRPVEVRRRRE